MKTDSLNDISSLAHNTLSIGIVFTEHPIQTPPAKIQQKIDIKMKTIKNMKWVRILGEDKPVLQISQNDAKRIAEILKTKQAVLQNRFQHYLDKRDSGEATGRDTTLLLEAEEDLNCVNYFIKINNQTKTE